MAEEFVELLREQKAEPRAKAIGEAQASAPVPVKSAPSEA
jgi:hypothetical protein